jgi:hypothetical protein
MSFTKNLVFIIISIFISACQEQQVGDGFQTQVQGIDRDGKAQICLNNPTETCPQIISLENVDFIQTCTSEGGKVHQCGCEEYLCEPNKNIGLDINGVKKSCKPIPEDTICTMEFTEGDQYRSDCKESGGKPIQCGCHEYLCQYPEMFENEKVPEVKVEYSGTNQEGIVRSCVPDQNMGCPTVLNKNTTYAFNCKEDGFDVAWCSCNEVLCLDQE